MSVTREEVIWAYRMLLAREPESEAIVETMMAAENLTELRLAFFGSAEFRGRFNLQPAGQLPIGRFLDIARNDIDLDCTPNQLQRMFDRIGIAWQAFGTTEPHWSVLTSEEYRQEKLAANIDNFYASGRGDIELHLNFLRRAGLPTRFARAMDFGCGVGRLSMALAEHASQVVGIDISPPHLNLAGERARAEKITNVSFHAITSVDDLHRYDGFDFVISRIVLQHNPPPVMAALYGKLLTSLAPGGVAIVQMPTFMRGQKFAAADYLDRDQPQMEMNALPQNVVFDIIADTCCRALEVREDGAAGEHGLSHTFVVQKAR